MKRQRQAAEEIKMMEGQCKGNCGRAGRGAECGTSRGSKED